MAQAMLSYDVLIIVFEWLRDDYKSLFACSLVNRTFKEAAATYLYRKVTYAPPFSNVLDLRRRDDIEGGFFASARLPHNAPLVRRLEVGGYLSGRPPPVNRFPAQLKSAVECWRHLQIVVFAPKQYPDHLFADILPLLSRLPLLRSIAVNGACADEQLSNSLVQILQLESLTIESPTRAILQRLPEWLERLVGTLRSLRLTHSCGSVTPGVLRSYIPHVQSVTTFALGLSYSLTDTDVFTFWQDLPSLHTIDYRYYLQLRPSIAPRLPRLRHLTVRYSSITTKDYADRLCRWVRRVVAQSPLQTLRLRCENHVCGPAVSFDPLIEHLSTKHSAELRVLDMSDCFVGKRMLQTLCRACIYLEEMALSVSTEALDVFLTEAISLKRLHTASFNIRHRKHRLNISQEFAQTLIKSAPRLRRITIDGMSFEASKLPTSSG
ncbi:hypothetical protein PYCCODRAFT_1365235 [Trametes coccinea BRFM310]|uniref:F-box domain-containing protein n=1 Tax=Trametes coccinea (strain BRFM310) TaxID=1353009 RepID=A0A1Y2IRZ1_TRAC3|nr:hypothetical protein PYCCODRAFT_1365235 [Trametes coccinea BRFM310]